MRTKHYGTALLDIKILYPVLCNVTEREQKRNDYSTIRLIQIQLLRTKGLQLTIIDMIEDRQKRTDSWARDLTDEYEILKLDSWLQIRLCYLCLLKCFSFLFNEDN